MKKEFKRKYLPLFIALLSLPFWAVGIYLFYQETMVTLDGKAANAAIIKELNEGDGLIERYFIDYEFKTKDKQKVKGSSLINNENWRNIHSNTKRKIPVIYSISNPEINRLAAECYYIYGAIFALLGLLLSYVGVIWGYIMRKNLQNEPSQ
ncbi:MAG: hypothetical protein GY804_13070 [Alphaproteobacteria bacterium]|nr:hypothetical protein [Alphaproteobacteria bacterium]